MRKFVLVVAVLLVPGLASAATPSEGLPLAVRRGFFTETDIGGVINFGGYDGYSNLQTYLQLGLGYSIPVSITSNGSLLDIGVHVGIGANAQNCYSTRNKAGDCVGEADPKVSIADNFTMTFLNLSGALLFGLAERLYLGPKLVVGYTLIDPHPSERTTGPGGLSVGGGVGIEYATNMDHFSVGLDVTYRLIIVDPVISSLQFYARVKYTF